MKISLFVLLIWALLCVVWNVYGSVQIANGGRALGPTATIAGAVLIAVLATALVVTHRRWVWAYRILAVLGAAMAAFTIWNSFRLDPGLWPSEFWRWAGIAVNALGVLGALAAMPREGSRIQR